MVTKQQQTTQKEPAIVTRVVSAVIPAYSDIEIVKNSVVSLATQWIPENTFRLEIIIVSDNPKNDYSYFCSESFKPIINKNIDIVVLKNSENYGQGISRQIGIDNASSNWIVLCDEDDMYAPNALFRFWEILNEQHCGEDGKPVALIAAPVYGFDICKERQIIHSGAIWVNGKLYNRQFLRENNIRFPEGENSHRAEDYPFIESLNYAIDNSSTIYKRVDFDDDADTFYYWIPNRDSRSRREEFYTALLTPFTMSSSLIMYNYMKKYNKFHNIEQDKDEFMKNKILNICIYFYLAYNKWLYDGSCGWTENEKFLEKDWELLKSNMSKMKKEIKKYWKEICPSDIWDVLHGIKHESDIQFIEPFICPFKEWIEKGDKTEKMSYEQIKEYCKSLKFDEAKHEKNAPYVKAWCERHNICV